MDPLYLCPVCQGPVPVDVVSQKGSVLFAYCPHCDASLVRDSQQGTDWQEIQSSGD